MTSSLARFGCPTCGALLGEDATRGAVRCEFCGRRATLTDPTRTAPRSVVAPTLDRSQAILALRRTLLAEHVLLRTLRTEIQPVDVRLVYVPYHVVRGIRTGVLERTPVARPSYETTTNRDGTREVHAVRREPAPTTDRARVVLTDVERAAPAVRRPGWGLESLAPGALVAHGAVLEPFDPDAVRRTGAVLAPDVEVGEVVERLRAESARGETKLHQPVVRTVLLPVWRIRYRVRGGLFDATLDAVEGRLLAARAPENDRHRVPIALLGLGFGALAVGWVVRVLVVWPLVRKAGVSLPSSIDVLIYVAFALLFVLAVFSTYAWNVVRYDAERVFEDGRLRGEYLNKPPSTGLERFWEKVFGAVGQGLDPTRGRDRDD